MSVLVEMVFLWCVINMVRSWRCCWFGRLIIVELVMILSGLRTCSSRLMVRFCLFEL